MHCPLWPPAPGTLGEVWIYLHLAYGQRDQLRLIASALQVWYARRTAPGAPPVSGCAEISPSSVRRYDISNNRDVFRRSVDAIRGGELIHRESRQDKEFHFQNWCRARLAETGVHFEEGGRNSYPDFRIVEVTEGFEVKGLAYPGREVNYDCNSQVPSGNHNGRTIFYLFGRYPSKPDGNDYPVLDLVICHGDFLNADHEYSHRNRSVKGFGSYGDIMIRDRKMYVAPTPFGLLTGVAHAQTLILPDEFPMRKGFREVGRLVRREADRLIVGYNFDLQNNELTPETVSNPAAGREHAFRAWRLPGGPKQQVGMRPRQSEDQGVVEDDADA